MRIPHIMWTGYALYGAGLALALVVVAAFVLPLIAPA